MTFELEVALEQAGKQELLDVVRSVKPDDMECIYVRQAAGAGPGPCGAVRPAPGRQRALRGAAGRRPDGRRAAGAEADGRAVRGVAGLDPGGAGGAGRAHAPLRHRRRHAGQRARDRRHAHRREAGARGRAVTPGRGRPLHPDAGRVPRDRHAAARRRRRDPAHRRHRRAAAPREGVRLPLRGQALRLRQQGRLPRRPTSSWRWPTRSSGRASASSCAASSSERRCRATCAAGSARTRCRRCVCSTSSLPVWRAKAWKSRTEPGSVATTFSTSPLAMSASAFLAFRIGSGQFRPRVSISFCASIVVLVRRV